MEKINPKMIKFASKTFGERHVVEVQCFPHASTGKAEFRIQWGSGFNQKLSDAANFSATLAKALEHANTLKNQLAGPQSVSSSLFDRVELIKPDVSDAPDGLKDPAPRKGRKAKSWKTVKAPKT